MADNCFDSGDACCAPPPVKLPEPQAMKPASANSCDTDAACGCHGGVLHYDGVDPRLKLVLWTVIAINDVPDGNGRGSARGLSGAQGGRARFPRRYRHLRPEPRRHRGVNAHPRFGGAA
jgi:hypothetical protein